jgi:hypothetical protein
MAKARVKVNIELRGVFGKEDETGCRKEGRSRMGNLCSAHTCPGYLYTTCFTVAFAGGAASAGGIAAAGGPAGGPPGGAAAGSAGGAGTNLKKICC